MDKYICIDFDGTVVDHQFPKVGHSAYEVVPWLQKIVKAGGKLILFTMRSDQGEGQEYLQDAIKWFKENSIPLYGIQINPTQERWTSSPKAYGHMYIDDAAIGCPLIQPFGYERPCVDWSQVGPIVLKRLQEIK